MLSRSAETVYWLARYIERAEATARLLVMGQRMALLPGAQYRDEWRSVLRVTGCEHLVPARQRVSEIDAISTLVLDARNPNSIRSALTRARENGRAARTGLTQEMWEALNEGWRRLETVDPAEAVRDLSTLIDWTKNQVSIFRGAVETTMLRNEGYDFLSIGGALERAGMTLRLLDVKYHVLLPETEVVGGGRDHYQWTSVLDALSGKRAYHHVYGGTLRPWLITDFLIRNEAFPRSLAFCVDAICKHLNRLAQDHGTRHVCHDTVDELHAKLSALEEGAVFQSGLHEFVGESMTTVNRLSHEIAQAYHF